MTIAPIFTFDQSIIRIQPWLHEDGSSGKDYPDMVMLPWGLGLCTFFTSPAIFAFERYREVSGIAYFVIHL